LKNPYRSSEEEYYAIPEPSQPGRGANVSRAAQVNGDMSTNRVVRSEIPTRVTTAPPRHSPVVHSGGRTASTARKSYSSSEEEYYANPATSRHGSPYNKKKYTSTLDSAIMDILTRERDENRPHIAPRRAQAVYTNKRVQPEYLRHADTVMDDYGDNWGSKNPRDSIPYFLNYDVTPRDHSRRGNFEGSKFPAANNASNDGWSNPQDLVRDYLNNTGVLTKSDDSREKGPPPSTRRFDRISRNITLPWEQAQERTPVPDIKPIASIERPGMIGAPSDGEPRGGNSRRPVSLFHDKKPKRTQREEYYEARDSKLDRRLHHLGLVDKSERLPPSRTESDWSRSACKVTVRYSRGLFSCHRPPKVL
jgi:hypothetical protein